MRTSEQIKYESKKQKGLTSGETHCLEELRNEWIDLYNDKSDLSIISNCWCYDSLLRNPKPFLQEVAKLKVVPRFKYVVNYLLLKCKLGIGRENLKRLYNYLESVDFPIPEELLQEEERGFYERMRFERAEDVPVMDTEMLRVLWKILSKRTKELFVQNGYRENKIWGEKFRCIITQFNFNELKDLAFGTKMDSWDFDVFLYKVLKRSKINVYFREEVLIYLTLEYGNDNGCNSFFEAYNRLEKLYPEVSEHTHKVNDDEAENKCDINYEDTRSLRDELDGILQNKKDILLDEALPELEEYFKTVECLNLQLKEKKRSRFSEKRFRELWDNVCEKVIKGELDAFKASQVQENEQANRKIMVKYPVDTEVRLREGTRFYCNTVEALDGEKKTSFYLEEDVVLPKGPCKQPVKVKAISPANKLNELRQTQWAKSVKFGKTKYIRDNALQNGFFRICSEDEELLQRIDKIYMNESIDMAYVEPDMKENPGELIIQCQYGTSIPKGTRIIFEIQKVEFEYETIEEVTCSKYAEAEIVVKWQDYEKYASLAKEKEDLYIVPACTELHCNIPEIHRACFSKPVKIPRRSKADKCDRITKRQIAVEYPVGREISLKKGTKFSCDTKKEFVAGKKRTTFCLEEDIVLPEKTLCKQPVKVRALSSENKLKELQQTQWARNVRLGKTKYIRDKALQKGVFRICTEDENLSQGIDKIYMNKKNGNMVYVEADMKENPGELIIQCQYGTSIPKGTRIIFEIQKVEFEYETIEEVTCSKYAEAEIMVEWQDFWEYRPLAKERKEIEVIATGTRLESDVSELHKVYLKKRVAIKEEDIPKKENTEEENVLWTLQFLYNISRVNAKDNGYYTYFWGYDENFFLNSKVFQETKLTSELLWPENEEQQRNYILTLLFLLYELKDRKDSLGWNSPTEQVLAEFDYIVAEEMYDLGFQPLSMSNPYDAFLMLLLTCDSPFELFQSIWSDKDELNKGII